MNDISSSGRDSIIKMSDSELQRQCRVDVFRGPGKGGQKRNTTESAVRVVLAVRPDISAVCDKTRSQHSNRRLALFQLRRNIAFYWRVFPPDSDFSLEPRPGLRNPKYPLWQAGLLDHLDACGYQVGQVAKKLGSSTGRLVKLLANDPEIWSYVNRQRERIELKPLRK